MFEDPVLTWIQAQLARPDGAGLEGAAGALAAHRRFCAGIHATLRLIHVLALEALLLAARDRREAALDALGQAIRLAEPGGIIRPFLDLRPSLAPLLRALATGPAAGGHVQRVLAAASGPAAPWSPRSPRLRLDDGIPVDALTPRELEVLALLEQRFSNREIAARLVVSPVTVKTHAHSIYSKLNARNRREAVARARDMGLLSGG
jgi:LuxR family maltose regulon positive regulatory protein